MLFFYKKIVIQFFYELLYMSNYIDTSGHDLSSVFGAATGTYISNDTGFKIANGTDLRYVFLPLSQGQDIGYNTGFKIANGADLRTLFGKTIPTINLTIRFESQGRPTSNLGPNTTQVTLTSSNGTVYYNYSFTPTNGIWTAYQSNISNVPKTQLTLKFQNTITNSDKSNALYNVSVINTSNNTNYISNGTFGLPTSFNEPPINTANLNYLYYTQDTSTPLTNWAGRYVILGPNQVWGYTNPPYPSQFVSLQNSANQNGIISQTFTPT